MTESFVTQCPHCQTRFRVTRAQLGMARGAVRCGACLQVFNAAERLHGELEAQQPDAAAKEHGTLHAATAAGALAAGSAAPTRPAAAEAEPAPEHEASAADLQPAGYTPAPLPEADEASVPAAGPRPSAAKPIDDTLWIHDDLDLDALDLDLDAELAKLEQDSLELSSEFRDLRPTHAPFGPARDDTPDPHDESWVEALLNEPDVPVAPAEPAIDIPPRLIDEPPLELEAADPDFPELDDDIEEARLHAHDALVAERDEHAAHDEHDERDEPISVSAAAASLAAVGAGVAAGASAGRGSEPRLRDEGLFSLDDEPLQLDWHPPRRSWARRLLWSLLMLLALGGLAAQYVYYNFDQLARQEQLRPWFERLCPLLGCQLPPRVDVNLVKSSNLTVRNHPTHPGALTVDAILYNRADFSQPFPLLELRFEDINGQPLASRRFKPSEYLAGELAGQANMPPQTPIHIALEIVDPGTRAVNYRLAFHSPD